MDLQTYAILKKKIDSLSGPEIKTAVSEYLASNPTAINDSLGIQVVDGKLCMDDGLDGVNTTSESDA